MNQAHRQPLIQALQLAEQLDDCVVLDCRFSLDDVSMGQRQYAEGHIPGAVYMHLEQDLSSPREATGGRHPLPKATEFSQCMSTAGVGPNSRVVVYDASRFAYAARAWWLLRYFGHDRVQVLDGGYAAWLEAGLPIATETPAPQPGAFQAKPRSDWVEDWAAVHAITENPAGRCLVDSREEPRYQGLSEPIDPLRGHIPGALNYPWQEVTDDQGLALPPEQQARRWQAVPAGEDTVVYCGSGVTACVNLLSMAIAGLPAAKLYPGSWSDWCDHELQREGDA